MSRINVLRKENGIKGLCDLILLPPFRVNEKYSGYPTLKRMLLVDTDY